MSDTAGADCESIAFCRRMLEFPKFGTEAEAEQKDFSSRGKAAVRLTSRQTNLSLWFGKLAVPDWIVDTIPSVTPGP